MNLYKVTTQSSLSFFAVCNNPSEAYDLAKDYLKRVTATVSGRELKRIEMVATSAEPSLLPKLFVSDQNKGGNTNEQSD